MDLYTWITTYLFPLFGTPDTEALAAFNGIYWLVLSCIIVYFTLFLPFRFFRWAGKLPAFFPWGDR